MDFFFFNAILQQTTRNPLILPWRWGNARNFQPNFTCFFHIYIRGPIVAILRYAEILNETSKVIKSREFIVETTVSVCIIATYLHSLITFL